MGSALKSYVKFGKKTEKFVLYKHKRVKMEEEVKFPKVNQTTDGKGQYRLHGRKENCNSPHPQGEVKSTGIKKKGGGAVTVAVV